MTERLVCQAHSSPKGYEIEIGREPLHHRVSYLASLASRFALITEERVASLYGRELHDALVKRGLKVDLFSFPSGELHKTRATKEFLEDQLLARGLGRDTCVIALGGGVVTDLAGYLAATYCRGVKLVMVPTTLLGMVDASVGGKTGVNLPCGKNLIGAVYPPNKVWIDLSFLTTLPEREILNGIAEMIKYGAVIEKNFFTFLEEHVDQLLALDPLVMAKAVFESCRIKKEIVEEDEWECGKRHVLNFGHTIGHVLETLTQYALSHGEAISLGMVVESHLSMALGRLSQRSFERIRAILRRYALPPPLPLCLSLDVLLGAMKWDKKSTGGRSRFVILDEIGLSSPHDSSYCTHVEEFLLKQSLQWMNDALCGD